MAAKRIDEASQPALEFLRLIQAALAILKPAMNNMTISRRRFVKASAAVAGSFTFDNVLPGAALGANSRIRIGVIAYQNHPRLGYIGLQDHGSDCWFKNLKLLPRKETKL